MIQESWSLFKSSSSFCRAVKDCIKKEHFCQKIDIHQKPTGAAKPRCPGWISQSSNEMNEDVSSTTASGRVLAQYEPAVELLHQRQKQRTPRRIVHTIWMFQRSFFLPMVLVTPPDVSWVLFVVRRKDSFSFLERKKRNFFYAHLTWRSIMALPITFPHNTCAPVDTALSTHLHTISVRHDKWADCSPLGHRLFPWTCTCGHDNKDSSTETFLSVWKDDT